jgi:hypothetical protein
VSETIKGDLATKMLREATATVWNRDRQQDNERQNGDTVVGARGRESLTQIPNRLGKARNKRREATHHEFQRMSDGRGRSKAARK